MSDIKVSIVIPIYNVEKYLRQCLDSVCGQTLKEIEVIAVNDGSTDGSVQILKEYEERYPDILHVYHIENQGVSHARNFGVTKAVGEYILFVDSDDFVAASTACELLYNKAVEDGDDIVLCKYYDVREKTLTKKLIRTKSKSYNISYESDFNVHENKFELIHISPFPWDKLYKRELIAKYPFPQGLRFEDLAIMYPVICDAQRIGVIKKRLYNYRRASTTSFLNSLNEHTLDIIPALSLMVDSLKANGHFTEFYEEIEYICVRHLLVRLNLIFDNNRKQALENRGMLELKQKLIRVIMDYLEKNFPGWQENRYLKYSASDRSKKMLPLYHSKKKMLRLLWVREKMPLGILRTSIRVRRFFAKKKENWNLFWKRKHKLRYLKGKSSLLKLFSLPRDVEYTKYYQKLPVSENQVFFESKHGEDVAGNIFHMLLAMKAEQFRRFDVCVTLPEELMDVWQERFARYGIDFVRFVVYNSTDYLKLLATAKYLITDTSLASYYIKRKEQVYLNTWHGTPLKAMGRIVPQREYALGNVQRNFMIADYLLYQNEFSRDVFLDDYMIRQLYQGKILLSGYPRNSAFFADERREIIREKLQLADMQVMAYMPTWRGLLSKKENKKQIEEIGNYLYDMDAALEENQVLFVKLHPYVKEGLNYDDFEHIRPFPEEYETYDFLNATDLLITDYSSIMFDYAVSGRKIILFTYDRAEYVSDRGMYIDLDAIEFPQADTVDALMEKINDEEPASYENFRKTYCPYDNKDTALEVCEFLFFGKQPHFSVEKAQGNGKKNVLVMINALARDDNTTKRIKRMNAYSQEEYNYFYCVKAKNVKDATKKLSLLKREIGYLPLMFDVNYTVAGRIACTFAFRFNIFGKGTDRQINRLAQIEKEKYFGDIRIDYLANVSNRDRLMHHICGRFDVPKVYNFLSYQDVLYRNKRKYRKNVRYVIKHLGLYDYVVGSEELTKLSCAAFEDGSVKRIITQAKRFELDKILDEIRGDL
ncbi:MAG: CDP-glycerol glycerophosphotransferase family protein [Lachnospiraceae bacterium]|nr:CDP-glycerol glycerophosphotransferase family protein [Lachnospiraceae bacterium]